MAELRNEREVFVGKPLGKPKCRWEDNCENLWPKLWDCLLNLDNLKEDEISDLGICVPIVCWKYNLETC